jgi:ABC-2 type transport system permease protein
VNEFRHILRKELREIWRQPGTVAALAGLAVLVTVALGSALPRYRSGEAWKAAATRDVREQWVTQGARHPHSAAHFGILAFRPLESTALIEPGVSMFVGQMLPLETHQRAFPIYPPAEDLTSAARMSPLSPALLSLTLVPLIVILTGYRAISGEREGGNLNLVLASGVSPRTLIAGKAAALIVVGASALTIKAGIELAFLAMSGATVPVDRFVGLQLVHAAYVLIWICLTIAISARARSSQMALSLLLALWIVNSFVLPRVGATVGRLAIAEPSTEEFRAAIQHDITYRPDGTPWVNEWSKALVAETLEKYGVTRIEDLPIGYAGVMLKGSDAHHEEVFEKHFARLHAIHRRQDAWQHALSIVGPMIAARSLGQAFAGTDLTHAQHFADAAERYRRLFVESTNDAIEKGTTGTGWTLRMNRGYWESIPAFQYIAPSMWWAVRQHGVSLAVLAAWVALAALGLSFSHRYVQGR